MYLNLHTYQFKILVGTEYHSSLLFQIVVHVPQVVVAFYCIFQLSLESLNCYLDKKRKN
jgi:hypothetical protein